MAQAILSDLVLHAALILQHKNIHINEHQINKDFTNLCQWLIDNKFIIHVSENKTKYIPVGSNQKLRQVGKPNIMYNGSEIKLDSKVTYLDYFSHISCAHTSESKRYFNVKSSTYYFHMKTKILADFHICVSLPLKFYTERTSFHLPGFYDYYVMLSFNHILTMCILCGTKI